MTLPVLTTWRDRVEILEKECAEAHRLLRESTKLLETLHKQCLYALTGPQQRAIEKALEQANAKLNKKQT